jgi:hypothetical protein
MAKLGSMTSGIQQWKLYISASGFTGLILAHGTEANSG